MKRVFIFVFVILVTGSFFVANFYRRGIPTEKVIGRVPVKQSKGLTISTGQEVDLDRVKIFTINGSGDLVCGIDNEGHAFLGQGYTWKECSLELMRDFGYKVEE
ncbi:MAG: hypothetical protein KGI50_06160 [Patescibacteria group bacterium]|nr:hypothetical protein [Patescibacteria group bacterium]MDE2438980.1 hypothetical protein [Patescibacteria group bacterium]